MACTLLEMCARCIAKHSQNCNLLSVLSYEWPEEVLNALWRYLPVDHVIDIEPDDKKDKFSSYWSVIIKRCKKNNYAFKRRLDVNMNPFVPWHSYCSKMCSTTVKVQRQVLLNSLFQEAIDIAYLSDMGKKTGAHEFALHCALEDNHPDIHISEWLTDLSNCISNFHFNVRHGKILCEHRKLMENIARQCQRLDLLLNVTLDGNYSLFLYYYLALYWILPFLHKKCVVFCIGNATSPCTPLLKLCSGVMDTSVLADCNQIIRKQLESSQPFSVLQSADDIWDSALGEHYTPINQETCDIDIYDDLPSNDFHTQSLHDSLCCSHIHHRHIMVNELVLEFSHINETCAQLGHVLESWVSLENVKISLPCRSVFSQSSVENDIIASVSLLLDKPHSRLKNISLWNFLFSTLKMVQLLKGLHRSFQHKKLPLKKLTLVECSFGSVSNTQADAWNVSESKHVIEHLTLSDCKFLATDTVSNFSECFFTGCCPTQLSIFGRCTLHSDLVCNNYEILYEFFNSRNLLLSGNMDVQRICEIHFSISEEFSRSNKITAEQWFSVLPTYEVKSFTFYKSEQQSLPQDLYHAIKCKSCSCEVVYTTLPPDAFTSYTVDDYISEM